MPRPKANGNRGNRDNIYQRGSKWYVRIWVDGREIRQSAGSDKRQAQELLGKMRADAEREALGLATKPKAVPTLADWAPDYMRWAELRKRSAKRDAQSVRTLVVALGGLRLSEITKARVEAFMQARRATESLSSARARDAFDRARLSGSVARTAAPPAPKMLSAASVNREVACLRKMLNLAVEQGVLQANPIAGIRLYREAPGRIPTLEAVDETALFAALPAWMRPICRIAVMTGLRQSEILGLHWRHVDLDGGMLTVEDSKSGEARRVPMHPALVDDLRPRRGTPDDFVVAMPDKTRSDKVTGKLLPPVRDPHSVSQAFRRTTRKIGRPDLRFHDLRHVCGSRLLATGASLPEIATVLGHKTLAMSRRYAHVSASRLASLVASMPVPARPILKKIVNR